MNGRGGGGDEVRIPTVSSIRMTTDCNIQRYKMNADPMQTKVATWASVGVRFFNL